MKIDVSALNLRELETLLAAAERRKTLMARRRPVAVVRRELIAFAASHGYRIGELIDVRAPVRPARRTLANARARVAPKYRDPANKRRTWSGRGRMPRWLADQVKRGHSVTDFLIPGLARPTAKSSRRIGQRTVVKRS
ncbi:H-NS family nucleoid-associated regulatory protein [Novilysobacter selenitireducens]|uniref:H-NS histone family protein n=1 Tax=Novilysobacter selenitireducens TaxID=2872639 RepID=A0ABS7T599_9GAMM|nr:H-NS histone family protein [Lysobacter selenitireducens]MBZ4039033.1 H-NS histone family protein [Lysobacter selenitireducens]